MTADRYAAAAARVAHEDLLVFINACFACTGQREFYSDGHQQTVAIAFLHEYIRGNYRRLYARTLAAGINDYNRGRVIHELLTSSRGLTPAARAEEGALIAAALAELPPQRAYRVLVGCARARVNNRRTRALIAEYVGQRRDLVFDAVKYRGKLRALARHAHLRLPGELPRFLARDWHRARYATPLLDAFRRAHYSREAVYELPYSIAEGLAAKHGIDRATFLAKIAPRMTAGERLRLQRAAARADASVAVDLAKAPLTRLALYALGLPLAERRARLGELDAAMRASAARSLAKTPLPLGRVACVLDRSYSSAGSSEKSRRPLAVAVATAYLVDAAAEAATLHWAPTAPEHPLLATPRGQTDLAGPLVDALATAPELVVVVSDGYDNDPPGGASMVLSAFRRHLDPRRATALLHANPVFDAAELGLRALDPAAPTLGVRDAEDLPTLLAFARFADGALDLADLEALLEGRAAAMIARYRRRQEAAP
ncbi:MAG: hypothetical protein R3A79_06330 [Nannocystaceae bacterium]